MPGMIKIATLQPGKYVVAVSGGVDSMVLLELLLEQPSLELIVAHIEHGVRSDSKQDLELVQRTVMSHNIKFEYKELFLGAHPSEALARQLRYDFLYGICKKYNARALITAHHLDDLLETAIINLTRGTGRLGLSSLRSTEKLIRPLIAITKAEIVEQAIKNGLQWHEDSTNQDQTYQRNYVRHSIIARQNLETRQELLEIIVRQTKINDAIETQLFNLYTKHVTLEKSAATLPRYLLTMMPNISAYELLQFVFKKHMGNTVETQLAIRALNFIKTSQLHKHFILNNNWQITTLTGAKVIVEPRAT
jgi:tRNA(Ile)-lysidine synthetase-like protein